MEINEQDFVKLVEEAGKYSLVDFYSPWCGPCKIMTPIIDELSEEFKDKEILIGKVNIDEHKNIAEKFNIMAIPTQILFKNGKIIEEMPGLRDKDEIIEAINKNF
jgi:thioredoxin 1